MGKLLIVSISDHEEHIFNRVMAAIADEPDFDHIAPPQSSLSFSNLEILLKEHAVYCNGDLIPMTQHEVCCPRLSGSSSWLGILSQPDL